MIAKLQPQRILALDGLRGVAPLMVLLAHLSLVIGLGWISPVFGQAGVCLFFSLSGFLITGILLADKEDGHSLAHFYNRRVARILPAYYAMILAVWFMSMWTNQHQHAWQGPEIGWASMFSFNLWWTTPANLYFTTVAANQAVPPVMHTWSLCVEEHFYWFWPLLVMLLSRRAVGPVILAVIVLAPVTACLVVMELFGRGFEPEVVAGLVNRTTPIQITCMAIGAAVAAYRMELSKRIKLGRFQPTLLTLIAVPALVITAILFFQLSNAIAVIGLANWSPTLMIAWPPVVLHILCGSVFCLVLQWIWLGTIDFLGRISRISYGLYIYHLPIYAAFGLLGPRQGIPVWQGVAAVAVTFAVAAASFRWFESPILAWMQTNDRRMTFRIRGAELSLGVVMTAVLALVFTANIVFWLLEFPIMAELMRTVKMPIPAGAMFAFRSSGAVVILGPDGFRWPTLEPKPIAPKTKGAYRIAFVGTSYTLGMCVDYDETYSYVAGNILKKDGLDVDAVNCGINGSNPAEEWSDLQSKILPLKPDAVFLQLSPGDISEGGQPEDVEFDGSRLASVLKMKEACGQKHIPVRVFIWEANPTNINEVVREIRLEQELSASHVEVISMVPYLIRYRDRDFGFSRADSHPNSECHRIVGEILARYIESHHLAAKAEGSHLDSTQPAQTQR